MDPKQEAVKALGGAGMVGMAVAVFFTHDQSGAWDPVEVTALGAGIGAAVKYAVGWLDILKARFTGANVET
jgi:hypothetical protein